MANDLREISNIYRHIENASKETKIEDFLIRRSVLNAGAVIPVLLWLLDSKLSDNLLYDCTRALESFLVRRTVCGYSTRRHGDLFPELIQKLDITPKDNVHQAIVTFLDERTAASDVWPSDAE